MKYGYTGKFKAEENTSSNYVPSDVREHFYCYVYPGNFNEDINSIEYGETTIKVRILPISINQVRISGYSGVYTICRFDRDYALLKSNSKKTNEKNNFLISLDVIRSQNLRVKEV